MKINDDDYFQWLNEFFFGLQFWAFTLFQDYLYNIWWFKTTYDTGICMCEYMFIYMNFECAYVISFGHTVGIKRKSHAMLKHFASTIYNCIVTFRHVINLVVFTWMGIYWLHLFMSGQIHFILPHFPMIKNAQNASM